MPSDEPEPSVGLTFCDKPSADSVDFEQRKKDSLAKQKQGKGQWDPELASDSEEAVKADRAEEDTSMLQDRTKKVAEESAKKGESVRGDL
jgi:ferredoxin